MGKLSGTVNFKSAQCNNFDIDSTNATTIALNGDTFLSQVNSPVTLKSIDALTVTGQNNILEINNQFTFSGSLILAANSQLIIKFSKDAQIPSMYFNTATPIVIGNGSLLEFQGMGPVQCANGVRFVLTPSTNSNPVTTLAVSDAALLTIDNGGTVVISGQGAINCSDYAGFKLINPSQLKFGAANNDKLALSLNRNAIMSALVNKGIVNSSSNAYISFAQGGYSLDIAAGSILQAGLQGVIEFNLNKGVVSSSNCTAMTFGLESVIQSDLGGKIAFAPNSTGNLTPLLAWNSIGANFKGTGLVQLYDKTTRALTLMGQLSLLSVAVNFKNNFESYHQFKMLINPNLLASTTDFSVYFNGKPYFLLFSNHQIKTSILLLIEAPSKDSDV